MGPTMVKDIVSVFRRTKLFQNLSKKAAYAVAERMEKTSIKKDFVIIREGEEMTAMYYVQSGSFSVTVKSRFSESQESKMQVGAKSLIGELAVLHNYISAATIRSETPAGIWRISRTDFRKALRVENEREIKERMKFLARVPLLKTLTKQDKLAIAKALEESHYSKGDKIVRQGEIGACMYIVKRGMVSAVWRASPNISPSYCSSKNDPSSRNLSPPKMPKTTKRASKRQVARYGVGDFFGEMALYAQEAGGRRMASVVAKTDNVILLRIWKRDVKQILSNKSAFSHIRQRTKTYLKSAPSKASVFLSWTKRSLSPNHKLSRSVSFPKLLTLRDVVLGRVIGRGTFGEVRIAKRKSTGQCRRGRDAGGGWNGLCVVKIMSKKKVVENQMDLRAAQEAKILRMVQPHAFIVEFLGAGRNKDIVYLIQGLCEGGELFSLLQWRRGGLSISSSRFFAATVVEILDYLHKKNIVYRDLKPENLLLDAWGYLKLVDFGFAKSIQTHTYTLCGTPEYMAPEVLTGTGHSFSADLWSLGCLVFEMCAGYPPFYESETSVIYERILNEDVEFPEVSNSFPKEARDLVRALLRKRPIERKSLDTKAGIRQSSFFMGFDFARLRQRRIIAPREVTSFVNSFCGDSLEQSVSARAFAKFEAREIEPFEPPIGYDQSWEAEFI
ncbi:hypothetical protein AAMO2058_000256300 [Amorphochlora amoebiformis]